MDEVEEEEEEEEEHEDDGTERRDEGASEDARGECAEGDSQRPLRWGECFVHLPLCLRWRSENSQNSCRYRFFLNSRPDDRPKPAFNSRDEKVIRMVFIPAGREEQLYAGNILSFSIWYPLEEGDDVIQITGKPHLTDCVCDRRPVRTLGMQGCSKGVCDLFHFVWNGIFKERVHNSAQMLQDFCDYFRVIRTRLQIVNEFFQTNAHSNQQLWEDR